MLAPPLDPYVVSAPNFERWLWTLRFLYFSLDCLYFFLPFHVTSSGFELRLIISLLRLQFFLCFHNSLFFGLLNTVSLRSHYCAWGRALKRPRTRSTAARQVSNAHERDLVTNQNVQFRPFLCQTYLLESLFSDPVREQLGISASGDWRILCRVKKH